MTVKTVLSPSALNIMIHKCRRCFWLTQNKVWKRPSDGFPQITNGMDNVLKEYFRRSTIWSIYFYYFSTGVLMMIEREGVRL